MVTKVPIALSMNWLQHQQPWYIIWDVTSIGRELWSTSKVTCNIGNIKELVIRKDVTLTSSMDKTILYGIEE